MEAAPRSALDAGINKKTNIIWLMVY